MRGAGYIDDGIAAGAYRRQRLVAAIALLQPGIDPIFLVLLSHHNGLALADHGLVVAGSQTGMAAGALLFAALPRISSSTLRLAAFGALAASLATVAVSGLAAIIATRALFGFCNGVLYAAALAAATRRDPAHAMGTVLLAQLLLATAVALALPQIAALAGTGVALATLAGFAAIAAGFTASSAGSTAEAHHAATGADGRSAAAAVFLFVSASMMVWSYVGAEGVVAGLSETVVGVGVALGSLSGGGAALLVAQAPRRNWPQVPVVLAGSLAAVAMLSPLAAPASAIGFAGAMILFNIGATYAVAQFSAHAIGRAGHNRRLVPALHSGGMVAGPLAAAAAVHGGGFGALGLTAAGVLGLGVAALAVDARRAISSHGLRVDAAPQQICTEPGDEALTQT